MNSGTIAFITVSVVLLFLLLFFGYLKVVRHNTRTIKVKKPQKRHRRYHSRSGRKRYQSHHSHRSHPPSVQLAHEVRIPRQVQRPDETRVERREQPQAESPEDGRSVYREVPPIVHTDGPSVASGAWNEALSRDEFQTERREGPQDPSQEGAPAGNQDGNRVVSNDELQREALEEAAAEGRGVSRVAFHEEDSREAPHIKYREPRGEHREDPREREQCNTRDTSESPRRKGRPAYVSEEERDYSEDARDLVERRRRERARRGWPQYRIDRQTNGVGRTAHTRKDRHEQSNDSSEDQDNSLRRGYGRANSPGSSENNRGPRERSIYYDTEELPVEYRRAIRELSEGEQEDHTRNISPGYREDVRENSVEQSGSRINEDRPLESRHKPRSPRRNDDADPFREEVQYFEVRR